MVFSALTFLCVFLPILICIYFLVRPLAVKNAVLVLASLLFYAYGEPVYIVLMVVSIVVNYCFGRIIGAGKHKKAALVTAVVLNLGVLGVFKYAGWLTQMAISAFGLSVKPVELSLPIGISFYTFQALSYLIDVYRGECASQKNAVSFFLYISFFPQLIAGPIVKYHDIESQISDRHPTPQSVAEGLRRFIIGLGKKVLIANIMAGAADAAFALDAAQTSTLSAWIGAVAYLMQIYFDFSGYSDMAIGLGRIFGFKFLENFNYPYISGTVKEFWRRWHISLSTWFREYLYIPLGGNRKGRLRTCVNKIIVFFCTGLWHGANLTFVVWGLFHGAFLLLEDFVPIKKLPAVIRHIYTVLVVCVGFVIFRSDDMGQAGLMISHMFSGFTITNAQWVRTAPILTPMFITFLAIAVIGASPAWRKLAGRINGSAREVLSYVYAAGLLVLSILYLSGGAYNPFIYFRF
ncbi:MAG: MBOAT family protein [Lachnospiraceae bacterium]|nr:MBOAT family protein [Lachnospiraceae bacterium]